MYGVKDCNGIEIEPGDKVRVTKRYPDDEFEDGALGGVLSVDIIDGEEQVWVGFQNEKYLDTAFYGYEVETLPPA